MANDEIRRQILELSPEDRRRELIRTAGGLSFRGQKVEDESGLVVVGEENSRWECELFQTSPQRQLCVLVVDDDQQEIKRAMTVIRGAGHSSFWPPKTDLSGALDALWESEPENSCIDIVLTDLMYPGNNSGVRYCLQHGYTLDEMIHPCGLLLALECLRQRRPVAVVTSGNHHDPRTLSWIHDCYLMPLDHKVGVPAPFVWNDRKDWAAALYELEGLMFAQTGGLG